MQEPLTDELLGELLESPSASSFVDKYDLDSPTLSEYLAHLLDLKHLKRSNVIRDAGLNAMALSLKEASRLLQAAGANDLYCKRRRDAIIAFCLSKGCSLYQTNEELYRLGEDTIC